MKNPLITVRDRVKNIRGSVLFRWFVSYLAILLIPLLLSVTVYFYSLNIINRSSNEIYEASLEQFRIEVDNFISSGFQTLQQLALNPEMQALTMIRGELQPRDQWKIIQTIWEIQKIRFIFPMINDILIVLNYQGSIMNNAVYYPIDLFYRLFYKNEIYDFDSFTAMMKNPPVNRIIQAEDKLFLFQPGVNNYSENIPATFVISYKKEIFDNHFFSSFEGNGGMIFINQGNNQELYGSGKNGSLSVNYLFEKSVNEGIINNERYHVLSIDSQVTDWKYFYFIPENIEKARAKQIQFFTFGGLFICSFFGLFLSYWLSRRQFNPVKKLMSIFGIQEKPVRGEDEFRWIERKAMDTQTALGNNYRALRKYFIHTLLEKPFDPVTGKREMEHYNISLEGEWNLAVIFVAGFPAEKETTSENEMTSNRLNEIIRIFKEASDCSPAANEFSVEMIDSGEYASAIVNWSGDSETFISRLEKLIECSLREAAQLLQLPVFTAMGEPHRGPEGIFYSNLEARETLKFLDPKADRTLYHYHDIKDSGGWYRYTFETEQKLVNLVRLGDSEAACGLLRQVWAENSELHNLTEKISRYLAYNLLESLIKGMEQDISFGDFNPQNINLENIPLGELANTLEKAADEICKLNLLSRQKRQEHQFSEKVRKYIDENFRDPDINISITSLQFNITPAYLSALFSKETGISLLEYINTLRIEEGKKLLKSGCEVSEAAEKCGFRSSGAFIRVFKKFTGITPGQYREI